MASTAERLKAAKERDEEGIDQDEPTTAEFVGPENVRESEPEPTEPEPEPEPEPAPDTAASGLDAEQAAKLEKATGNYFRAVERVFGADNVPPACTYCEGLGFDLTGGAGQPEFAEHDQYVGCGECHGLGHVKTGSKVPGHDLHDCPKCLGRGYLEKLPGPVAVPPEGEQYGTPAWMGTVTGNAANLPG